MTKAATLARLVAMVWFMAGAVPGAGAAEGRFGALVLLQPDVVLRQKNVTPRSLADFARQVMAKTLDVLSRHPLGPSSGFLVLAVRADGEVNAWLDMDEAWPDAVSGPMLQAAKSVPAFPVGEGIVLFAIKLSVSGAPETARVMPSPKEWRQSPLTATERAVEVERLVTSLWPPKVGSTVVLRPTPSSGAMSLSEHKGAVLALAFSRDGKTLATAGGSIVNGEFLLWDVATGQRRLTLAEGGMGHALAFSPDGARLLTAGVIAVGAATRERPPPTVPKLLVWDTVRGAALFALEGHQARVSAAVFSPDGKYLATGGGDMTVRLWNADTGAAVKTLTGHSGWVHAAAFSPDGKILATSGGDSLVKLWDVASGGERATLKGHNGFVTAVVFTPDGRHLVSGSGIGRNKPGELKVWGLASGSELRASAAHRDIVNSLALAPDGATLASGSRDRTVKLWDLATLTEKASLPAGPNRVSVAFSSDGKLLATADGTGDMLVSFGAVRIWDVATQRERLFSNASACAESRVPGVCQ